MPTRACLSAALQTRLRVWPTPRRLGTAPRPGVVTSDRVTASVTRLCHAPRDPLPGRRGFDAAKVYWPVCVCLWCCCPSAGTPGFDAGMVCWPGQHTIPVCWPGCVCLQTQPGQHTICFWCCCLWVRVCASFASAFWRVLLPEPRFGDPVRRICYEGNGWPDMVCSVLLLLAARLRHSAI